MAFPDSFRAARWIRTINLGLQAALFLTLFAGLNYVARNHAWRFDLTQARRYSLTPETLSFVKDLKRPVEIIVTLPEDDEIPEVRGLLDEYVHATADVRAKITVRYIDLYQDRRKAEEFGIEQAGAVMLRSGDKRRGLSINELYRMKEKQRDAFIGEQVITAALLDVSSTERVRVYFLTGHGELHPGETDSVRGLSLLREALRSRNFAVDTFELAINRQVPDDASLLIAVGPQSAFTPAEQEMLRQYLSVKAGRLVLFLGPGRSASQLGLDELLLDWGVLVDDDVVIDPAPESRAEDYDLIVRAFDEKHPIVQGLVSHDHVLRFGFNTRTVRVDPGRPMASGLTVVPLAATSKQAWGEVAYQRPPFTLDANDVRPLKPIPPGDRLSVAVASERVSVRDNLPFSVRGGRLVVFGTDDAVSNRRIGYIGNFEGLLGAINWAVDRDRQINVPPRPVERFQLALSAGEFMKLRAALVFGLPGAALLLGVIVYWSRRR